MWDWALSAVLAAIVILLPLLLMLGVLGMVIGGSALLAGWTRRLRLDLTSVSSETASSEYQLSGEFYTMVVRGDANGFGNSTADWSHDTQRVNIRLLLGEQGGPMAGKAADLIRLLEAELDFIEGGGYGRPVKIGAPQRPMFERTLVCIDHWFVPGQSSGCSTDCVLMDFVPDSHKKDQFPCHYIALNEAGETVKSLEAAGDQQRLEAEVTNWLRAAIKRLKEDKDASGLPEVKY